MAGTFSTVQFVKSSQVYIFVIFLYLKELFVMLSKFAFCFYFSEVEIYLPLNNIL